MRADDLVGKQIDGFTIEERIGRGGMASVYRAHQSAVHRDVALKVIQLENEAVNQQNFRRRFAKEAELIATLEHIHILPVYDYGIEGSVAYLAMRLLRGGTLSDIVRQGPMQLERVVEIFTQVARGLSYAHSKGIIHRDLKPSNIMLDSEGDVFLTDFGLAKLISSTSDLTKSGNIVGTPAYMSPEQLRGDPLDARSDIYSLGVILYMMLTGQLPFDSDSGDVVSVIYKHLEKMPELPSKINPALSPALDTVVMKALAKRPDERFGSAQEMATALRSAVGMTASTGDLPRFSSRSGIFTPEIRRSNLLYFGSIMVGIVAGLFIIMMLTSGGVRDDVLGAVGLIDDTSTPTDTATITPSPTDTPAPTDTPSPTPIPMATILSGREVNYDEIVPSDGEVEIAQQRLGTEGFIGLIACNRTSEYHAGLVREIADFAAQYGLTVRIYDSNNDQAMQIALIEEARSDRPAGLIICPLDINLIDAQLRSIDEADIPLVLYTPGEDTNYGGVAIIGDAYLLGLEPGRYAGQIIVIEMGGEANVVILDYPELPSIVERANGMRDGVLEFARNATIIGRFTGGTRENGYDSVTTLLEAGVGIDVIVSINDAGSYGAIDALAEANIPPEDVVIVSVDAEAVAQEYIRNGYYMRGSMGVARTQNAEGMVYAMIKLLAGSDVPELIVSTPLMADMVTRDSLALQDAAGDGS